MAISVDEFRARLEQLAISGASLTDGELNDAFRMAVSIQAANLAKANGVVRAHTHRPIMSVYMNDGWPAFVTSFNSTVAGPHLLRMQGRYRHEFLLERRVLRVSEPDGDGNVIILSQAPRSLCNGKSVTFIAGCHFGKTLRAAGAKGPCLNLYVFDGTAANDLQGRLFGLARGLL